jgi:vacuolar protein sorting-associated protein 11
MKQIEGTSLLVTVAEDLPNEPVLKVWALDKTEKKTGAPRCLSTVTVQNARRPFPVGAMFDRPWKKDRQLLTWERYLHLQL